MPDIERRPGPCDPVDGLNVSIYAWHRMFDAWCLMSMWHYTYAS